MTGAPLSRKALGRLPVGQLVSMLLAAEVENGLLRARVDGKTAGSFILAYRAGYKEALRNTAIACADGIERMKIRYEEGTITLEQCSMASAGLGHLRNIAVEAIDGAEAS